MIDIIIPAHNLLSVRGWDRVFNGLVSLNLQTKKPNNVFIMNSSSLGEYRAVEKRIPQFDFVNHIHCENKVFNKSWLLNEGIKLATSDYVMCTDADYMFKKDFIESASKKCNKDKFILKEVMNLSECKMTFEMIEKWVMPRTAPYVFQHKGKNLANGGCQLTSRQWFIDNPYDERLIGCGGMDNLCVYKAEYTGLKIEWMKESEIVHQWHRIDKFNHPNKVKQFKENQRILEVEYKIMFG